MTIYTTPLQLGYFFSLLMTLVFLYRGLKQERLSDKLLGIVMLILALELQDYTFGFAGINFLWKELNGFPRDVSLLFGPSIYFYLKSQFNSQFKLEKKHLLHLIPWAFVFLILFLFFAQGAYVVQAFQESKIAEIFDYFSWGFTLISYTFYFLKSIKIYKEYRNWTFHQFSNLELISFSWFRNFLYFMGLWVSFKEIMTVLDFFLELDYYEDWWWNLALAATAIYVGLQGYAQKQPTLIDFKSTEDEVKNASTIENKSNNLNEEKIIAEKLKKLMQNDRLFLQPEISLSDLAKHLKVNSNSLSACINKVFKKNYNDYINELRIEEFEEKVRSGEAKNLTLLSLAYDSGFNSKATFNRAFKKLRDSSPREFMNSVK